MRRHIRLLEYDPGLNRTLGPSDDYLKSTIPSFLDKKEFPIHANSSGFLLPFEFFDNETKNSAIIMGDSIAECLFMEEEFRIESRLRSLNLGAIYLNAAISSATTLDLLNIVLNKIIPTMPKKVFLMSGVYDGMINERGFFSSHPSTLTTNEPMEKININNHFFEHRKILLKSIIMLLDNFNIELFLGTFSHRHNPQDPNKLFLNIKPPEQNLYCLINKLTRELALEAGCGLIDFEELFFEEFDIHYDNHHLTPKGAELVAHYLHAAGF